MLEIQEKTKAVSIDLDYLEHNFFYFDIPVEYKLESDTAIKIYPVTVRDSEFFLFSKDVLEFDKNSLPDVKIIQMSYLQYLNEHMLKDKKQLDKFINILVLCLKFTTPYILQDEKGKPFLYDKDKNVRINEKQFEDIRRIILYQNIVDYDDEYINPELKKNLQEVAYLKNKNIEIPTLERKIAIITSHTGILKSVQLEMTYRSHSLLFQEVYEETEYTTIYPILAFAGKTDKTDKWIYKIKKGKFADQTISVSQYNKQAGGDGKVAQKIVENNKEE